MMNDERPYVRWMADRYGDARRSLEELAADFGIEGIEEFIDWCHDRWPDGDDAREYGQSVEGIDYTDPDLWQPDDWE